MNWGKIVQMARTGWRSGVDVAKDNVQRLWQRVPSDIRPKFTGDVEEGKAPPPIIPERFHTRPETGVEADPVPPDAPGAQQDYSVQGLPFWQQNVGQTASGAPNLIQSARQFVQNVIPQQWGGGAGSPPTPPTIPGAPGSSSPPPGTGWSARAADKFDRFMGTSAMAKWVAPDYLRAINSPSAVMKTLAYHLLDSPSGILRNNTSAANMRELYLRRGLDRVNDVQREYRIWARKQGATRMQASMDQSLRQRFDDQLLLEMNNRRLGKTPNPLDPQMENALRHIEEMNKQWWDIAKPQNGRAIGGFENATYKPWYMPQIWQPREVSNAVGKYGRERVVQLLTRGYQNANSGMPKEYARAVAKAVVNRMQTRAGGQDELVLGLLESDGRDFIEKSLLSDGMSPTNVQHVMDKLFGKAKERGTAPWAKQRVEIDMSAADGDLRIVDLFDKNITRMHNIYGRAVSGRAAMARIGIETMDKKNDIIQAILKEQEELRSTGKIKDESQLWTPDQLETLFSYFGGSAFGAGLNPVVRMLKMVTNLGYLSAVGLTQLAEVGQQIVTHGMVPFFKGNPIARSIKNWDARGQDVITELRPWLGRIGEEHLAFRDELNLDEKNVHFQTAFMNGAEQLAQRATRLQGYTSLFYHIRGQQQRLSVILLSDKLGRYFRGDDLPGIFRSKSQDPARSEEIFKRQMRDFGWDDAMQARIKAQMTRYMQFDQTNTFVDRLNLDKWDDKGAVEAYALGVNRYVDQVVMNPRAGERSVFWNSDFGSLMVHLKTFPLVSINKQISRTLRVQDPNLHEAAGMLLFTVATASLAVIAKETLNKGVGEVLGGDNRPFKDGFFETVIPQAIAYGNLTSAPVMAWDTMAALTGQDNLRFNQYTVGGRAPTIASMPAMDYLNQAYRIPQATAKLLTPGWEASNSDINALMATPVFGRMIGLNGLIRSQKE